MSLPAVPAYRAEMVLALTRGKADRSSRAFLASDDDLDKMMQRIDTPTSWSFACLPTRFSTGATFCSLPRHLALVIWCADASFLPRNSARCHRADDPSGNLTFIHNQ